MRVILSLLLSALLVFNLSARSAPSARQSTSKSDGREAPTNPAPATSFQQSPEFQLEDGTPIKLRLTKSLSSADTTVGDGVDFEVLEDIEVEDALVIPRGGLAIGTVTAVQAKRRMARGGKLNVRIDYVRLATPLRALKEVKSGRLRTAAMTGGMVGTAVVFRPVTTLFLLTPGKDITIPKETETTAYVNGDIPLDRQRFEPGSKRGSQTTSFVTIQEEGATVEIESAPDSAAITVDGSFMGDAPTTLKLPVGEHRIKIEMAGFTSWEHNLTLSSGELFSITAKLNPQ